jgi:hypothetical protein
VFRIDAPFERGEARVVVDGIPGHQHGEVVEQAGPVRIRPVEPPERRIAVAERDSNATFPNSLIRGVSGIAVLAEELSRVEDARMPMFELEPWPATRG